MHLNWMRRSAPFAVVLGLMGCGGGEYPRVYDVELDAAQLSDVPTQCQEGDAPPPGPARNAEARQRWTFDAPNPEAVSLEVPDIDYEVPSGRFRIDRDTAPDVLGTSVRTRRVFNFVYTRVLREPNDEGSSNHTWEIRYHIEGEALGDTIQGSIALKYRSSVWFDIGGGVNDCTSTLSFTGRLVD